MQISYRGIILISTELTFGSSREDTVVKPSKIYTLGLGPHSSGSVYWVLIASVLFFLSVAQTYFKTFTVTWFVHCHTNEEK